MVKKILRNIPINFISVRHPTIPLTKHAPYRFYHQNSILLPNYRVQCSPLCLSPTSILFTLSSIQRTTASGLSTTSIFENCNRPSFVSNMACTSIPLFTTPRVYGWRELCILSLRELQSASLVFYLYVVSTLVRNSVERGNF